MYIQNCHGLSLSAHGHISKHNTSRSKSLAVLMYMLALEIAIGLCWAVIFNIPFSLQVHLRLETLNIVLEAVVLIGHKLTMHYIFRFLTELFVQLSW